MAALSSIEVVAHSPAAAIVTLHGEHDLASRPRLARALQTAANRPDVLVDLSHCTFIDSAVIAALVLAWRKQHERDGMLELVIPPDRGKIRRVLELMSLERILPLHETRGPGIASLEAEEQRRREYRAAPAGRRHLQAVGDVLDPAEDFAS